MSMKRIYAWLLPIQFGEIHGRYLWNYPNGFSCRVNELPIGYDDSVYPSNERVIYRGMKNGVPIIEIVNVV